MDLFEIIYVSDFFINIIVYTKIKVKKIYLNNRRNRLKKIVFYLN